MEQKNTNNVHSFRVTDTLWNYILSSSRQCGVTPSVYLRKLIQEDKKGTTKKTAITQEEYLFQKEKINQINKLTYEINSIGVNINQIAKNSNSHFYSDADKKSLFEAQQNLMTIVQKYIERLK